MAVITNLDVNLQAKTRKFDRPLQKSGSVFGSFAKSVMSFSPAKIVAAGAAAAASVASWMALSQAIGKVNEQFTKIDEMGKFADQIGAGMKQLQALELQAKLTGTSQSSLENGIKRFNRVLGDARMGNSAAIKSFEQLGVPFEQFSGLTLVDQLALVSDQIKNSSDAAEKASKAYAVFGRQGSDLMTFFESGSQGIKKATEDINNFGVGLSRVDAAQIEQANDAFTRLQTYIDGVFQSLAVKAAPTITALIETFLEGGTVMQGFGSFVETAFSILNEGISMALNGWSLMKGAFYRMAGVGTDVFSVLLSGLAKIEAAFVSIGGKRFDFGVAKLAKDFAKVSDILERDGKQMLNEGLSGAAGTKFKARIQKIRADAEKAAEKQKVPPVDFEPQAPSPVLANKAAEFGKSLFAAAQNAGGNFLDSVADFSGNVFEQVGSFVSDFLKSDGKSAATEPVSPPDRSQAPSVGAMAAGSSSALSTIINARKQGGNSVEKVVKKTAKDQLVETKKTNRTLDRLISGATEMVLVTLGAA